MFAPDVTAAAAAPTKLQVQKVKTSDSGQVVFLRFAGVIDEDFNGQRLTQSISGHTLVIDLAGVRRISSYGIAQWSEFVRGVAKRTDQIFLVACSPKVMDQLNLVSDFAGAARLHSFLAPYRCDYCSHEAVRLIQLDHDWEVIRTRNPPEYPCGSCGHTMVFDDDPKVYLSYASQQGATTIPPEVQAYVTADLATRLEEYGEPLGPAFWAEKFIKGKSSYLRLTGNLDGTFPDQKLAEGLEGVIVLDVVGISQVYPAGGALWRNFMEAITPSADSIHLIGVPPAFERVSNNEDLGPKGQVVSVSLPFSCTECGTSTDIVIDFGENYDLFHMATPPERFCPDCKAPTVCTAQETALTVLRRLRKPEVPATLRKFIEGAKRKLNEERKPKDGDAAGGRTRSLAWPVAAGGVVAAAATAGIVAFVMLGREREAPAVEIEGSATPVRQSAAQRPAWITSDMPLAADCRAVGDRLRCVGVSSFAGTLDDGRLEASASALEALVQHAALQVTDAAWQRKVSGLYGATRTAKLENVERTRRESNRDRYDGAVRDVVDSRTAVVKALRKTAGSLAPAQVSAEYWEELQLGGRAATSYLVFAEVDVPVTQIKRLAELYSTPVTVRGAKVVTAFPGVAWRYGDVSGGALLLEMADGGLRAIGLTERYIVTAVQDRTVDTADAFASILGAELDRLKSGGSIKLVVKTGDSMPVEFSHPVQAIVRPSAPDRGGRPRTGGPRDVPLNTWDRVGGDRDVRDDPRQ